MFSENYTQEFKAWRSGRPAWSALISAVKDDRDGELQTLAADAGCSPAELAELRLVRQSAKRHEPEAAKYAAAQKQLDRLDREIRVLEKKAEAASAAKFEEASAELAAARATRDRFWRTDVIGPEQARRYVEEVAAPLGLV
jgi:hypothetical protein